MTYADREKGRKQRLLDRARTAIEQYNLELTPQQFMALDFYARRALLDHAPTEEEYRLLMRRTRSR